MSLGKGIEMKNLDEKSILNSRCTYYNTSTIHMFSTISINEPHYPIHLLIVTFS